MLDKNQKLRVLDEVAFIVYSGNLRPISDEETTEDDLDVTEEEDSDA